MFVTDKSGFVYVLLNGCQPVGKFKLEKEQRLVGSHYGGLLTYCPEDSVLKLLNISRQTIKASQVQLRRALSLMTMKIMLCCSEFNKFFRKFKASFSALKQSYPQGRSATQEMLDYIEGTRSQ